jgi:NitT/TauT family transport system permease protein
VLRGFVIRATSGFIVLALAAYLIGVVSPYPEVGSLPQYTLATVLRILVTLLLSLAWAVPFGILAATNRYASMIVTPVVDLLQSIPILGYFPLVIGSLFALGPLGVEFSVILLLFTSMAWSIFFSVIGAVRSIPVNVIEASREFGLTGWGYVRHVLLPAIAPATVAGANLAWSDGWFFMIAAEYINYKEAVVTPPSGGVGMLLARAAYYYQDMSLALELLAFVTLLVIVINSLTWHRLMERASTGTYKPIIRLGHSGVGILGAGDNALFSLRRVHVPKAFSAIWQRLRRYSRAERLAATGIIALSLTLIVSAELKHLPSPETIAAGFTSPPAEELSSIPLLLAFTMARLTAAYLVSLAMAIGLGVLAAENRRAAAIIYPLYDIGQGVPILALFPVLYLWITPMVGSQRLALEATCLVMLVLDMIWYMFINVTSAVRNIPTEISDVGRLFGIRGLKRVTNIVIPSILPAIVTGSILSWGTGWNTIIFAEYLQATRPGAPDVWIPGIGSLLDKAGYVYGNTVFLAFILIIISVVVLSMEALVWRRLLRRFEGHKLEV